MPDQALRPYPGELELVNAAEAYLRGLGCTIIGQQIAGTHGRIDLVALSPLEQEIFIEVRGGLPVRQSLEQAMLRIGELREAYSNGIIGLTLPSSPDYREQIGKITSSLNRLDVGVLWVDGAGGVTGDVGWPDRLLRLTVPPPDDSYDGDFFAWTVEQGRRIRAHAVANGSNQIDWGHVAEEVESMGRSIRREMGSRLETILEHMLKLAFSRLSDPRTQWRITITTQRHDLRDLIRRNPSLKAHLPGAVHEEYRSALHRLKGYELELALPPLPTQCPFDLETQILAEDWLPQPPNP